MQSESDQQKLKLAAKPLLSLLSDEDRQHLENVIARLHVVQDALHRAAASGIDVSQHQERHDMHDTIAKNMHAHWFPKELPEIQE